MDSGDRYVIPEGDDEWVRPQPVEELVVDAVLERTDYDEADLTPLSSSVDLDDLVALFTADADASLSFALEDHEVTVHGTGDVAVEPLS